MINLLICLLLISIPINTCVSWCYQNTMLIQSQLDSPKQQCHLTSIPFVELLMTMLHFLKGYAIPFLLNNSTSNFILLSFLVLTLCFSIWPPFSLFKYQNKHFFVLWGILSFFSINFFFLFPLSFILLSFMTNSFKIGKLASLFVFFFLIWIFNLNAFYLLANAAFLITYLLKDKQIFLLDTNQDNIKKSFQLFQKNLLTNN